MAADQEAAALEQAAQPAARSTMFSGLQASRNDSSDKAAAQPRERRERQRQTKAARRSARAEAAAAAAAGISRQLGNSAAGVVPVLDIGALVAGNKVGTNPVIALHSTC